MEAINSNSWFVAKLSESRVTHSLRVQNEVDGIAAPPAFIICNFFIFPFYLLF